MTIDLICKDHFANSETYFVYCDWCDWVKELEVDGYHHLQEMMNNTDKTYGLRTLYFIDSERSMKVICGACLDKENKRLKELGKAPLRVDKFNRKNKQKSEDYNV